MRSYKKYGHLDIPLVVGATVEIADVDAVVVDGYGVGVVVVVVGMNVVVDGWSVVY